MDEPNLQPTEPLEDSQDVDVVNEEDWSDDESVEAAIQLGFLEPVNDANFILFKDPDWRNWDGGKVGGWPIWLDPVNLPSPSTLLCSQCCEPLCFLMQIYCPLDEHPTAFHRALYVFCCKKGGCSEKEGSVKVFRGQLSRTNPYFCYDPQDPSSLGALSRPIGAVCAICGSHQKAHWKAHKTQCSSASKASENTEKKKETLMYTPNSFCFEEQEVVVEPEELEGVDGATLPDGGEVWEDAMTPGGKDEAADKALGQRDYNAALSEQAYDKVYVDFLTRIDQGGKQQVLRYISDSVHREQTPPVIIPPSLQSRGRLYVSETYKRHDCDGASIPVCEKCGAARALECQIMPQLLYYLKVDQETQLIPVQDDTEGEAKEEGQAEQAPKKMQAKVVNKHNADMTWGTLDIFTCSRSCQQEEGYVQEHVVIQALPLKA
eukprot:gene25692-31027_t